MKEEGCTAVFKAGFGKREVLCVNFQISLVMFTIVQGFQFRETCYTLTLAHSTRRPADYIQTRYVHVKAQYKFIVQKQIHTHIST